MCGSRERRDHRVITDRKASLVNLMVALLERVVLPRPIDLGVDLAALSARRNRLIVMILDFVDAFYTTPLHPMERRFA